MKKIVDFVLHNKLAVWILTILVVFSGIFSASKMKMESMPDISIPYLMVMTTYPGASAEQISTEVGDVLENKIKNLEDVKNISSTSYANFSMIAVEFEFGVDTEKKEEEIKKLISKTELNERIEEPQVMAISMDAMPVVVANVYDENRDSAELTELLQTQVVSEVAKVDGVGEVTINGATDVKYVLNVDEEKLAAFQLDKATLVQLIQANNTEIPLGIFEFKETEETVVVGNKYTTVDELLNMALPLPVPTKLGDVATIEKKGEIETISRINGKDSLTMVVTKAQNGNTVEVVEGVVEELETLKEDYKGIDYELVLDQAEPIKDSVFTMVEKALFGTLFAVVVILLFLKNIRSTLISIVSIPMSLLMSVIILKYMGITLNLMTLGALTVAIGRVIDDSVVVIENIFRRLTLEDEKLKGKELVKSATVEMFVPIMSSTLVTIAVFLPLVVVGGMIGELFMPFAFTMAFALISSLVIAITVVPMLAHILFKKELLKQKELKQHGETSKFTKGYAKLLEKTMNHKWKFLFATVVVLGISIAMIGKVGFTFMGEEASYEMTVEYVAPVGESNEVIEKNLSDMENKFIGKKGIETVQATTGGSGMAMMMGSAPDASITLTLDGSFEDLDKLKKEIEEEVLAVEVTGKWTVEEAAASMMGSNTASVTISGVNDADLRTASDLIVAEMSKIEGLKDVESGLARYYVENKWVVDVEKAAQNGLTAAQVAMQIMNYETEEEVTKVNIDGKETAIVDVKEKTEYQKPEELAEKMIFAPTGNAVMLKDVANLELGESVESIVKNSGKMNVTITANIEDGENLAKISTKVNEMTDELKLPEGIKLATGGTTEDMIEAFTQLGVAILAAIAIVYFILVVTFKEGLAPFAILFSLPLLIIGVVFGNLIFGEPLSVSSMLGILMLVGIVVTNAIVLVDKIIHFEKEGMELREAIVHAAEVRLRPIIMTALATVLALAPLLIQEASMSLISKGLAVTVIGGLVTSTILTLFVVPIMHEILTKWFKKDRNKEIE